MRNILFEFYYGNIRPVEDLFLDNNEEYQKAANQASSIEEAFLSTLDDNSRNLYCQLEIALAKQDSIEVAHIYVDGFRTGANIMLACVSREKTLSWQLL